MIKKSLKLLLISLLVTSFANAADTLFLKGKAGPGKGKHIVIITGDEEYRSEESGPMLGKYYLKSMVSIAPLFSHGQTVTLTQITRGVLEGLKLWIKLIS